MPREREVKPSGPSLNVFFDSDSFSSFFIVVAFQVSIQAVICVGRSIPPFSAETGRDEWVSLFETKIVSQNFYKITKKVSNY